MTEGQFFLHGGRWLADNLDFSGFAQYAKAAENKKIEMAIEGMVKVLALLENQNIEWFTPYPNGGGVSLNFRPLPIICTILKAMDFFTDAHYKTSASGFVSMSEEGERVLLTIKGESVKKFRALNATAENPKPAKLLTK